MISSLFSLDHFRPGCTNASSNSPEFNKEGARIPTLETLKGVSVAGRVSITKNLDLADCKAYGLWFASQKEIEGVGFTSNMPLEGLQFIVERLPSSMTSLALCCYYEKSEEKSVLELLSKFTKLTSLALVGTFRQSEQESVLELFSKFPELTSLTIGPSTLKMSGEKTNFFTKLFDRLPSLENLCLEVNCDAALDSLTQALQARPKIKKFSLNLDGVGILSYFRFIRSLPLQLEVVQVMTEGFSEDFPSASKLFSLMRETYLELTERLQKMDNLTVFNLGIDPAPQGVSLLLNACRNSRSFRSFGVGYYGTGFDYEQWELLDQINQERKESGLPQIEGPDREHWERSNTRTIPCFSSPEGIKQMRENLKMLWHIEEIKDEFRDNMSQEVADQIALCYSLRDTSPNDEDLTTAYDQLLKMISEE